MPCREDRKTITLASLRLVQRWLADRAGVRTSVALNALLDSGYGRSDWVLVHWSKTLLFLVAARRAWVDPDLAPLPF